MARVGTPRGADLGERHGRIAASRERKEDSRRGVRARSERREDRGQDTAFIRMGRAGQPMALSAWT